MANVAQLKLIQINNFPEVESPEDWIVVSDAAGLGYKISKENFKAFLGTVTVSAPKAITPTDPSPTLDGVYKPTIDGVYTNLGGIEVDRSEGGVDFGKSVEIIKNGSTFVKVGEPLPQAENKIPKWEPIPYDIEKQVTYIDQFWGAIEPTTSLDIPGESPKWATIGKGERGVEGKSNYDLWLEAGNTGSLATYFASLKGAQGVVPPQVAVDIQQAKSDATTALSTAQEVRDEFDQVVANANTSNPEVVQARAGEATLNQRIVKIEENSISPVRVLSTIPSPNSVGLSNTGYDRRPFVTFVDDDGFSQYYANLAPILEAKGFVGCVAIVTTWIDGVYMTIPQLLDLQSRGHEIISHSYSHQTNWDLGATLDEIDFECRQSKEDLINWGLQVESIMYPGGQSGGSDGIEVIKRYYRSGWGADTGGVQPRYRYLTNQFTPLRIDISNTTDIAVLKAQIDACLLEKSWVVFMSHANTFDSTGLAKYQELIDYVYAQGVEVGTMKQGLDIFGNSLDVGGRRYLRILSGGEVVSNFIGSVFKNNYDGYAINHNTHLSGFENDKKTYSIFRNEDGGAFPELNYGVLETSKSEKFPDWSHQIWRPEHSKNSYIRYWTGTSIVGSWGSWEKEGNLTVSPNTPVYNTALTDVPSGITVSNISSANSADYPTSNPGTLLTFKVNSEGFLKQFWFPLNSNAMYIRSFVEGGTKGNFSKYIRELKHTFVLTTVSVPANGSAVVEVDLNAIIGNDFINNRLSYVLSSRSAQVETLIYTSRIAQNILRVRLYNPTDIDMTLWADDWDILFFI